MYRVMEVSITSLQIPGSSLNKIELTMDGYQVNAGYRF